MARAKQSEKDNKTEIDLGKKIGLTTLQDSKWAEISDKLPTFIPQLDYILGGGIPFGRLTEIMGKNASGKSTLAVHLTKVALQLDCKVIWIDTEGTADPSRLSQLGVDVNKIFFVQPKKSKNAEVNKEDSITVEFVAERVEAILNAFSSSEQRIVIIWDSIGHTPSIKEIEQGVAGKQPGIKAKAMAQFATIIAPMVTKSHCAFIGINQARDEMGSMFGAVDSPGGNALHHWASLRLEVKQASKIEEPMQNAFGTMDNVYVGHKLRVITKKSKVSTPRQSAEMFLLSASGLQYEENIYRSCVDSKMYGLIKGLQYKSYIADDGKEYKMYGKDWVPFLQSKDGEKIRKELFQKMMLISFPTGYSPLDNEVVDVNLWEDMKGLIELYKKNKVKQPKVNEGAKEESIEEVLAGIDSDK